MGLILLAALTLFVLPVFVYVFRGSDAVNRGVDAFVMVTVLGIIAVEILPALLGQESMLGIGFFVIGLLLPMITERLMSSSRLILGIAIVPLFVLHCALDGVVVASTDNTNLVLAVLIHRLPAGLLVFIATRKRFSTGTAFATLGLFALATVAGGLFGGDWLGSHGHDHVSDSLYLEAFLAGALTHVLFHVSESEAVHNHGPSTETARQSDHCGGPSTSDDNQKEEGCGADDGSGSRHAHLHTHSHGHSHGGSAGPSCHGGEDGDDGPFSWRGVPDFIGLIAGFLVLYFFEIELVGQGGFGCVHGQRGDDFAVFGSFVDLALESSFALCIAYVLGGLLFGFFPETALSWLRKGSSLVKSLKGVLFGLPLPICSCGVLPLYQTLAKKGVPPAAGLAFLVATPELGLDAILLSIPLLGYEFTWFRIAAAFVLALAVGMVLGRLVRRHEPGCAAEATESTGEASSLNTQLKESVHYGFTELVDNTMPWVIVGLTIAAFCAPLLSAELFEGYPQWVQVPLFGLIGIPIYVCASGATPIAAIAMIKGVSPGAVLAFLLTGPATNVTTFGILRDLHGKRVALMFGAFIGLGSVGLGLAVNAFYESTGGQGTEHVHHAGQLEWICLAFLVGLVGYGILRKGLRGFFRKVVAPHG